MFSLFVCIITVTLLTVDLWNRFVIKVQSFSPDGSGKPGVKKTNFP